MKTPYVKLPDDSPVLYPSYTRTNLYVDGFDGTKLALEFMRPVDASGKVESKPLPVVLTASRGGRFAMLKPSNYINGNGPLALYLIARGYVFVIAEMRGCGASFGVNDSFASPENRKDVAAIIKWITSQPWCDGHVGMMGGSNRSFIQMTTATSEHPEGLTAITPCVSMTDFYYMNYPNGVSRLPSRVLSGHVDPICMTKEQLLKTVVPVDDDPNGDTAYEAYQKDQYPGNKNFVGYRLLPHMCRDSYNPASDDVPNMTISALEGVGDFYKNGIKNHQFAGWFDANPTHEILGAICWRGCVTVGPWNHQGTEKCSFRPEKYPEETLNVGEVHRRWFDHSLKNIDNGWDRQPFMRYYTINADSGYYWRWTTQFPPREVKETAWYLSSEKSGTVASVNDGSLVPVMPAAAKVDYKVDDSIQVFDEGNGTTYDTYTAEWDGDMTPGVDCKSLTFTTDVLGEDDARELTGIPVASLYVSSEETDDADFLAYLEEVHPDGRSTFITEGCCRASHRTEGHNPLYAAGNIPFHPSLEADVKAKKEEGMKTPVLLNFHLKAISWQLSAGSRLRLTIFCAENVTYQHPYGDTLPVISLYEGGDKPSFIRLPLAKVKKSPFLK